MPRNRIIPIFIPHIGCPHQCVFCNQKEISGCHESVDVALVRETISQGVQVSGQGAEVAFYGGSFTAIDEALQEGFLSCVAPFLASGAVSDIRISTRPDAIDDVIIERLIGYGVKTVELGCQSLDGEVLRISQRGHTEQDIINASEKIKKAGLSLVLQMMTDLPGDTEAKSIETAKKIIDIAPSGVRIYPTVVVKNTLLAQWYAEGTYVPMSVEESANLCAKLFELFLKANIPVLRLGIQPTQELSAGGAIAGAYHPAFGELVKSRVYGNRAGAILESQRNRALVVLGVAPSHIPLMIGQKRSNIIQLEKEFSIEKIKIIGADMEDWQILLQSV